MFRPLHLGVMVVGSRKPDTMNPSGIRRTRTDIPCSRQEAGHSSAGAGRFRRPEWRSACSDHPPCSSRRRGRASSGFPTPADLQAALPTSRRICLFRGTAATGDLGGRPAPRAGGDPVSEHGTQPSAFQTFTCLQ